MVRSRTREWKCRQVECYEWERYMYAGDVQMIVHIHIVSQLSAVTLNSTPIMPLLNPSMYTNMYLACVNKREREREREMNRIWLLFNNNICWMIYFHVFYVFLSCLSRWDIIIYIWSSSTSNMRCHNLFKGADRWSFGVGGMMRDRIRAHCMRLFSVLP